MCAGEHALCVCFSVCMFACVFVCLHVHMCLCVFVSAHLCFCEFVFVCACIVAACMHNVMHASVYKLYRAYSPNDELD